MWCAENWGTKWEANVYDWSREDDNTIKIHFDTAWGPPLALFKFLSENEWQIDAFYNEEGVCFAGYWNNYDACEYDYSGMTADEIEHSIPSEINDVFGIVENRRDWEDENEDEDDEFTEEEQEQALEELKKDYENLLKEQTDKE